MKNKYIKYKTKFLNLRKKMDRLISNKNLEKDSINQTGAALKKKTVFKIFPKEDTIFNFFSTYIIKFNKDFDEYSYKWGKNDKMVNIGKIQDFITRHRLFINTSLYNTNQSTSLVRIESTNVYNLYLGDTTDIINKKMFIATLSRDTFYMGLYSIFNFFSIPVSLEYDYNRMVLLNQIYRNIDGKGKSIILVDGLNIIRNKSILASNLYLFEDNIIILEMMIRALTRVVINYDEDYILLNDMLPLILSKYIEDKNIIIIAPHKLNTINEINVILYSMDIRKNIINFIFVPKNVDKSNINVMEVDDMFLVMLFQLIYYNSKTKDIYIFSGDKYRWCTDPNIINNRCCLIIKSRLLLNNTRSQCLYERDNVSVQVPNRIEESLQDSPLLHDPTHRENNYLFYQTQTGLLEGEYFHKSYNDVGIDMSRPMNLILVALYLDESKKEMKVENMTNRSNFFLIFSITDITSDNRILYDAENKFIKQLIYFMLTKNRELLNIDSVILSSLHFKTNISPTPNFTFDYSLEMVGEEEEEDNIIIGRLIDTYSYNSIDRYLMRGPVIDKINKMLTIIEKNKTSITVKLESEYYILKTKVYHEDFNEIPPRFWKYPEVLSKLSSLSSLFEKFNKYYLISDLIIEYKKLDHLELYLNNKLKKEIKNESLRKSSPTQSSRQSSPRQSSPTMRKNTPEPSPVPLYEENKVKKVGFQPIKAEPVVLQPIKAEPVVLQPIKAEPVVFQPIKAEPVGFQPIKAEPVVLQPIKAEPVVLQPIKAEPVVLQPTKLERLILETKEREKKIKQLELEIQRRKIILSNNMSQASPQQYNNISDMNGYPPGFQPSYPPSYMPSFQQGFQQGFQPGYPPGFQQGYPPSYPTGYPPSYPPGYPPSYPPGFQPY